MNTLYQRTAEIFDIAGNSIGWETKPVVFPDTFFLYSGLQFNWKDNTVTRNKKVYYLDKLVVNQELNIPKQDEWMSHYGNDIRFDYYTGDESEQENNPSGNIKNVKRATYLSSDIVKYILEYHYNANDQVVKILSLAPVDSISSGNTQQQEEIIGDETEQNLNALKFAIGKELLVTEQNTPVIRPNGSCVLVTRRKTNEPLLSDGIMPEENTGKITVSVTSPLWNVQCIAYSEHNAIIYNSNVVNAVSGTPTTVDILNTNDTPIAYIAINLFYNVEESQIDETTVNQEELGLTVTFVESINLVIRREGSEDIVRHLLRNDTVRFYSLPNASRVGYDFDGWYINSLQITGNFVITDSTVIEARYTKLYNLTKINGTNQTTIQIREGDTVTLDTPSLQNLTFVGWYKDVNGTQTYQENEFTMSEDITVSALYKCRLITMVDDVETSSTLYDVGAEVTLETPSMQGYTFDGWFEEDASQPTASPFTINKNTTLTARFTKIEYTVTLVNVDGRGLNTEATIVCSPNFSLTEYAVKEHIDETLNTFDGCYTDSEYTNAVVFPYTVTDNVTLYCKFQEIGG